MNSPVLVETLAETRIAEVVAWPERRRDQINAGRDGLSRPLASRGNRLFSAARAAIAPHLSVLRHSRKGSLP
jgi:hypothetical protein